MTDEKDEAPSLRETIDAAVEELSKDETPSEETTPEPQETAPQEPETPAEPTTPNTDDRPRDESGRFVAKEPAGEERSIPPKPADGQEAPPAATATPPEPAAAPDGPQAQNLAPPAGWSVAAKQAFDALPDAVKQDIAKRESEVNDGFQMYSGLRSHVEYAKSVNHTLPDLIDKWRAAEALLERSPVQGMQWLMQNYGVTPEMLGAAAQPQQAAQTQQPAQAQPQAQAQQTASNPMMQEIAGLKNQFTQFQQQQEQAAINAAQAEWDNFRADPSNKYAENVRDEMVMLLNSGKAQDLKSAYDQALWLNTETRAIVVAEQQKAATADQQAQQQAAAQQKRDAASSVTGSASDVTPAPGAQDKNSTARESIMAAMQQVGTRV